MKSARRFIGRAVFLGLAWLMAATWAQAQTAPAADRSGARREVSGIAAGYAGFDGLVPRLFHDGMWGVKVGRFPGTRFGWEFTFEQSIRNPGGRYLGGDFVVQFPKPDLQGPIPFAHVGAGALLYGWSHPEAALSFGAGIKQYITDRVGLRFGVEDRMMFRYPSAHLLDFYGGVVFRF